jgi:DNA modification methylase
MDQSLQPGGNGHAISRDLSSRLIPIASCKPLGRDTRKHPPAQVHKLAASLDRFGFVLPILTDAQGRVVAGWGLVLAARQMGLREVPAVALADLTEAELRTLRLALNRISEDSSWEDTELALEFTEILQLEPQIDLEVSGFAMGEIDVHLDGRGLDQEDELPEMEAKAAPVTRPGDVWLCGEHRIFCGDALAAESYARVLDGETADMLFSDPPYNVPIEGHASGLGAAKHSDFAMASGELSSAGFLAFLTTSLGHAASCSIDGAIHFVCMDWRHVKEMIAAGEEIYSELKNLCVWNKSNAGMGSLYRSKHELVFVFKVGRAPHINNVALGRHGRHRTNVWDYVSQNALNGTAKSKLALHPTVKPVAMVADAIRDCSNRNGLILDPFGGAGTTLIAAERTGRRARLIEIDPLYVDVTIARWQRLTGGTAIHADDGRCFVRPGGTAAMVDKPAPLAVGRRAMQSDDTPQDPPVDGDDNTYQVGYGRPPRHTQFQAGQSGNPIGRRKGVRNFTTDVVRTLRVPVKVTEGDGTRIISTQEGILLKLREKALRGDGRALDRLLELARLNNDGSEADRAVCPDDRAILDYYAAEIAAQFKPPASGEPQEDYAANLDPKKLPNPEVPRE